MRRLEEGRRDAERRSALLIASVQRPCALLSCSIPMASEKKDPPASLSVHDVNLARNHTGGQDSIQECLAKVFSKRDHIELCVKRNILENRKIPQELSSG